MTMKLDISKELLCSGSISAAVGAVLGVLVSLIVNCTLVEISLSVFFALYFGALFLCVGIVLLWRVSVNKLEDASARKMQLITFSIMIIVSGLLCFVLEQNWFIHLSPISKIPIYTLLGVSVSFALVFSLVDLINYLMGLFQLSVAKPLIESPAQVKLVLWTAVIMGGLFGFIFGLLDVEDETAYHIRLALLREEHLCYPIGAVLGGTAGFGNEYYRYKEEGYAQLRITEFDDDI